RAIVVDNDPHLALIAAGGRLIGKHFYRHTRTRPFAAVVDQIAEHFLEVLLFAVKASVPRHIDVNGDLTLAMEFFHRARERGDDRRNLYEGADPGRASG